MKSHPLLASRLPIELLGYIMELAAASESISTPLRFAGVSKTARRWMAPTVYRTTISREPQDLEIINDTNAAVYIHNLSLCQPRPHSNGLLPEILARCANLKRLVMLAWPSPRHMSGDSWPAPWELVILNYGYPWKSTILQNVTHFYFGTYLFVQEPMIDVSHALPRLTHFAFMFALGYFKIHDNEKMVAFTRLLLLSNPSLEAVVLHTFSPSLEPKERLNGPTWDVISKIPDERLLVRTGLENDEFIEILESGETIWADLKKKRFGRWRDSVTPELFFLRRGFSFGRNYRTFCMSVCVRKYKAASNFTILMQGAGHHI